MVVFRPQRGVLLLLYLLSLVIISSNLVKGHEASAGTRFDLIHRHELWRIGENEVHPISRLERLRQLVHIDLVRFHAISRKVRLKNGGSIEETRREAVEQGVYHPARANGIRKGAAELRIHSGADYGTGQYFVPFNVGSPSQKFVLIADTGSDLTWMQCTYKCRGKNCSSNSNKRRVFAANSSATFKIVPCSSNMCKNGLANLFSLTRCRAPMDPCAYDYRYLDGSTAIGLFAHETVTFGLASGRTMKLSDVLVGCSESTGGPNFKFADGVIGLGYDNNSFAVKAANKFGGKFSYCLVDHLSPENVSSYLIFGSRKEIASTPARMQHTALVLSLLPPFYAVNLKGISLGGTMLEIPMAVWDVSGEGGLIVDSGSSLTMLTEPAYDPVMTALKRSVRRFRQLLDLDMEPLEYCFNSTGFNESLVPRLRFHFADGARFTPPVKSYVIDAADGVKCLGFVAATWPGTSVLGNIIQQNHVWEYDIAKSRLGFGASPCT